LQDRACTKQIWHAPASNMFGASSELASVMEFGFLRHTVLNPVDSRVGQKLHIFNSPHLCNRSS